MMRARAGTGGQAAPEGGISRNSLIFMLVALVILTSSLAVVYYGKYNDQMTLSNKYAGDLNGTLSEYRALIAKNNRTLSDYNSTLSLLAGAVASLNTSSPAYAQASSELGTLWADYLALSAGNGHRLVYSADMLVNFGNGTRRWYNDTAVQPGWNGFVSTVVLLRGQVVATWYPQFQEHFVTGIAGVQSEGSNSWFVWAYGVRGWVLSPSGADSLPVTEGTVFAWTLCGYDAGFNPTCTP